MSDIMGWREGRHAKNDSDSSDVRRFYFCSIKE